MGDTNISSNIETSILKITEIFYSLQGEGSRAGEPSIFIRLSGCSAKHSCYQSGVICDTEFESGKEWILKDLKKFIDNLNINKCKWIIWTGGEPTDQLTKEIINYFKPYKQAIECSGIKQPPENLDWIVLSPKIAEHAILKKWEERKGYICDELRWVRRNSQEIPETKITAKKYYLSPHSDGNDLNIDNLDHCIKLCLKYPKWNLSVQLHKIWELE
tara:strand:+ start:10319 stop:10966 length:648 start_codon:yes stop_codon:yes gene_type:complete